MENPMTDLIQTDRTTGTQRWTTRHGDRVTVWKSERSGRWYWHVQADGNYEVVGQGQGHAERVDARTAAARHHPPVADPPATLVAKLVELIQRDGPIDHVSQVVDLARSWAAELDPLVVAAPVNPDRTEVELPRAWLAVPDSIPMPGQRVLLDGVPHEVYGLGTDPDRAVVRLARVTTTKD